VTILYLDGMAKYKTVAEMAAASGGILTQGNSINTTGGRFGGACISAGGGATSSSALLITPTTPIAQGSVVFIGASIKLTAQDTADITLMRFLGSTGSDFGRLRYRLSAGAGGLLYATDASSTTASVADAPIAGRLRLNQWYRLEIRFKVGTTSTDGEIAVHLDGVEIINVTGRNTRNGTQTLASISLSGVSSSSNTVLIDDLVVWNDQGTLNNTWLGDIRIDECLPTSNGTAQDWTPNTGSAWDAVNDTPITPDDDTTYIASTTPGQRSRFATAAVGSTPAAAASIPAVRVHARAKNSDATNAKTFKTYVHSGATDADATTAVNPGSTAYKIVLGDVREVDPDTAAAWTVSGANAAEAGVVEVV
jgi:hypothetical protein